MAARATPAFAFGAAPRVNLMPRIEIERRLRSALLRRWGWGLAAALFGVVLLGAAAFWLQAVAQQRLDVENTRTTQLLSQVSALQPVRQKMTLERELESFRAQAMGTDLEWSAVIATLAEALPPNVAIAEYTLAPGALPVGEDRFAETGLSGEVVLEGTTPTDIVALIRSVRGLTGVRDADGWAQSQSGEVYRYELRVEFDQSVYTDVYTGVSAGVSTTEVAP